MAYDFEREQYLEKPLPSDTEAERCLLGAVLLDNNMFSVIEGLDEGVFYAPLHRKVFKAMKQVKGRIDPITITAVFRKEGTLGQTGGMAVITNLTYGLPHFSKESLKDYILSVTETYISRELTKVSNITTSEALSEAFDAEELLNRAEERISRLHGILNGHTARRAKGFYSLAEMRPEFEQHLTDLHHRNLTYVRTGMEEVDSQLEGGGLQYTGLYYLAGPPKLGKTVLGFSWAEFIAMTQEATVLGVSAEMHRIQMFKRSYSRYTGIPYWMMRPGFYGEQYEQALKNLDDFVKTPLKISDNISNVIDIRKYCLKEQDKAPKDRPVKFVVIDYQQLISLTGIANPDRRAAETGQVSRQFKALAKEMEVPILAISTLSTDYIKEQREPSMFDFAWSGDLKYDVEAAFFLHDPLMFEKRDSDSLKPKVRDIKLILDANRGGTTNPVPLKFIGENMTFMTEAEYEKNIRATMNDAESPTIKPQGEGRLFEQVNDDELWNES